MNTELQLFDRLCGKKQADWQAFMEAAGLNAIPDADATVLAEENGVVAGAASRKGNVIKYVAVAPSARGLGITASLLSELRKDAFSKGIRHLFLYTKPDNRILFEGIRFYPVSETAEVLLMENRENGIRDFLDALPACAAGGTVGAVVMNADPFTLGHRHLTELAASRCEHLYVFVLSEENGLIPAALRMEMVKKGTADIANVTVCPTGDYLISSATFPDYFLKKKTAATIVQCTLDCRVFSEWFAPRFGITERFAGAEPFSPLTESYNRTMAALLPASGIRFTEFPRFKDDAGIPISASEVRRHIRSGNREALRSLVPASTLACLETNGIL